MDIEIQDRDRVRRVVLNRAAKRNALTLQMCKDIVAVVREAEERVDVGCVLLSGNGSAFCAGMDLKEDVPVDLVLEAHEELFTLGARAKKPIVVWVNGTALAGGLGLAAQGHIVLAAEEAVFGLPEVKIGLWPFMVYRALEAALGRRRTLYLSLTAKEFTAAQAYEWGLVQEIESWPRAEQVAREIANMSPTTIAAGLEYVRETENRAANEPGEVARRLRARVAASADYKEGVAAFREKREPHWPSLRGGGRS